MKYYHSIFILFLSLTSNAQVDTLKNDGIIKLIKSDISKEIVIKKIITSQITKFDLSADGLVNLKTNKVPDSVILLMMDRGQFGDLPMNSVKLNASHRVAENDATGSSELRAADAEDNVEKVYSLAAIKTPGIYYFDNKTKEYILLSHKDKVLSSSRQNIGKSIITLGAAHQTQVIVPNSKALLRTGNNRPVFYIKAEANPSQSVASIINPTELLLYKADVKKETRIISLATQTLGIPNNKRNKKNTSVPQLERVNNSVTKMTFDKQLFAGAYLIAPNSFANFHLPFYYEFDIK